jgi:hypothetical protein
VASTKLREYLANRPLPALTSTPSRALLIETPTTEAGTPRRLSKATTAGHVEDDVVVKYWMPILFGLHGIIMSSELDIRTK